MSKSDVQRRAPEIDGEALLSLVSDVSETGRAQQALEDRGRWLRESQRVAQLGHCVFDLVKDHWDGSPQLHDILGADQDHPRDRAGWMEIVHPADRRMLVRYFKEEVLGRNRPFDIEYRIIRPRDGAERWVHGMGRVECNQDGRPVALLGTLQDVTERRATQESLRVCVELLEASPACITVHTPQGEFLYANERAAETHGYTHEEFLALELGDIRVPESAERLGEQVRRIAAHGRDSFEAAHFRKDGSILPIDVSSRLALWDGRAVILSVANDITERKQFEQHLLESNARLEGMVHSVTEAMGRIVEARDPYTQGHELRVARLAKLLAEEMGLSADEIAAAEMAAVIHDVGKISVPAEILNKPGSLSANEFALIRQHPTTGYEILKDIAYPWPVAEAVWQHHERLDGSGYPRGLSGAEICGAARVVAVADVVEAMASHRPYRPAQGVDTAVAEIVAHRDLYDPDVVAACIRLHESGRIAW